MAGLTERVHRQDQGVDASVEADVALRARRHRGRRTLTIALGGAIAAAALAFWAGTAVRGDAGSLPQHVVEPPTTVRVAHEALVDGVEGSGTVALPAGTPVAALSPPLSDPGAQPVITGFGWHVGSRAQNGDVLAEVAGEPIFLLSGAIPAYRDLSKGDTGKDVLEFQRALERAGFTVSDAEGVFGQSTAIAVASLYHGRGYAAPMSPPQVTHGKAHPVPRTAMLPVGSAVYVRSLPAMVSAVHAAIGQHLNAGATLLRLTNGPPIANIAVEPSIPATVRRGMAVQLTTSEGAHVVGHVLRTSTATGGAAPGATEAGVAPTSETSSAARSTGATIVVTLPTRTRLPIGARVTAFIVRARSRGRVLVVPVSAVQHAANGGEYVKIRHGAGATNVNVVQGFSAGGYVGVSPAPGSNLSAGEEVVIPN